MNITLQNLEPLHIQKYYNKLLNDGLSANTIKRHHANIRKCLQSALMNNLIPYNPADRVKLPKSVKYRAKYYNKEQVNNLLEYAKGTPIETHILLASYYGLRRSEIAGLKWNSIDFVNKSITIKDTVTYVKTRVDKERTKNQSSHRTLPLIENIEVYLKQLKAQQEQYRLMFGREYISNDYVCKREDGKPISPDYVSEAFSNLLKKHNLPHIRFHDLRHSCASMLLSLGFDLKKISEWLGHSSISTTANIYGHVEFVSKVEMGEMLGKTLTF